MASLRDEMLTVVRDILAPLVRADGGDIYVIHAGDDGIELHLAGRYAGSPGNALAAEWIIEPAILAVAPHAWIKVTAGAVVPKGAERVGED